MPEKISAHCTCCSAGSAGSGDLVETTGTVLDMLLTLAINEDLPASGTPAALKVRIDLTGV